MDFQQPSFKLLVNIQTLTILFWKWKLTVFHYIVPSTYSVLHIISNQSQKNELQIDFPKNL